MNATLIRNSGDGLDYYKCWSCSNITAAGSTTWVSLLQTAAHKARTVSPDTNH